MTPMRKRRAQRPSLPFKNETCWNRKPARLSVHLCLHSDPICSPSRALSTEEIRHDDDAPFGKVPLAHIEQDVSGLFARCRFDVTRHDHRRDARVIERSSWNHHVRMGISPGNTSSPVVWPTDKHHRDRSAPWCCCCHPVPGHNPNVLAVNGCIGRHKSEPRQFSLLCRDGVFHPSFGFIEAGWWPGRGTCIASSAATMNSTCDDHDIVDGGWMPVSSRSPRVT